MMKIKRLPAIAVLIVIIFAVFSSGCVSQKTAENPLPETTEPAPPPAPPPQPPASETPSPPSEEFIPVSNDTPDLAVMDFRYSPFLPRMTEDIRFVSTVKNLGGKSASLEKYKITPQTAFKTIEAVQAGKDTLAPGETTEITGVLRISSSGLVTISTGVDLFNKVAEFNENNNNMNLRIRVQPSTGFVGCSGSKTSVCDSVLDADAAYFETHSGCTNTTCATNAPLLACDAACSHPRG